MRKLRWRKAVADFLARCEYWERRNEQMVTNSDNKPIIPGNEKSKKKNLKVEKAKKTESEEIQNGMREEKEI